MTLPKSSASCGLLLLGLMALPAAAQVHVLSTTAGLKAACENNPGNLVVLSTDLTVSVGFPADAPEPVRSGCRIQLSNGAKIQFDKVGLAFAGPLVMSGGAQSGVQMQEARIVATDVHLDLANRENFLQMENSRIEATAGHLKVQLLSLAKLEVSGARSGGVPLSVAAFAASGDIGLTAGRNLSAVFKSTGWVAGGSVAITATGSESSIGMENSGAHAARGDVRFDMTYNKSKLEAKNSTLTAVLGHVLMAVRGAECSVAAFDTHIQAGASAQVLSSGPTSEVKVAGGSVAAGSAIALEASTANFDGSLVVEGVQLSAGTDVGLNSGLRGKTLVFGNRVNANGAVRATTRTWGICEAKDNLVAAPAAQMCQ